MEKHLWKALSVFLVVSLLLPGGLLLPQEIEGGFAGYNGKVLLHSSRSGVFQMYMSDLAAGSLQVNLSNNLANDRYPRWSPDGSKIAFQSDRDGNIDIFVMDADGSNAVNLTNSPGSDGYPKWSPDGSKIAFSSDRYEGSEIYVMDADGSNVVRLTNTLGSNQSPSFSPDGSKIVYHGNRSGSPEIYIMDADGENEQRLTTTGALNNFASFSPDGSKIVFRSNRDGNDEIYVMDSDGSNQTNVTNNLSMDQYPSFSPDGSMILFHSDRSGIIEIYSMRPDGSQVEQITSIGGGLNSGNPDVQSIPNTPPTLSPKSLVVGYGGSGLVDVLAGASDEEVLEGQYVSVIGQAGHGVGVVEEGRVRYTPEVGFVGVDSLTYEVCDSFLLDQKCSSAVLGITVVAADAPVVNVTKVAGKGQAARVTTNQMRPTFSGTATPGASIRVEIHSEPIVLTTTADVNGDWSVAPSSDLPAGEHTVYVSATLNGQTTQLDSFVLGVQVIPNTGGNVLVFLVSGLVLLILGCVGLAYDRRRKRIVVPALFPDFG